MRRLGEVSLGKRRVLSEGEINQMVMPEPGQMLGIVTQMLGYDRLNVRCTDGSERICRIRGKMKRRVWIKINDIVLVAPWDFQQNRGDILWRYTANQAEILRSQGLIVR
jgi:translation initiation factor 1A